MPQQPATIDPRGLRQALGMFATGVTIVTARDAGGAPVGVTANSFNSVSLDPPLVLWSIARAARSYPTFMSAHHWNVHVLSVDQEELSRQFASQGGDKFARVALDQGLTEAPLLRDCSARFQCRGRFAYDGGDHIILVGEVLAFDAFARPPLVYVTGSYAIASPRTPNVSTTEENQVEQALFSENLLGYLLGRAHLLYMNAFRPTLAQHGLGDADFFILSLMALRQPISLEEIAAHLSHLGFMGIGVNQQSIDNLITRGLILRTAAGEYHLTAAGQEITVSALAACKAVQEDLVDRMGAAEMAALRNLLKRVIVATDPGVPKAGDGHGRSGGPQAP